MITLLHSFTDPKHVSITPDKMLEHSTYVDGKPYFDLFAGHGCNMLGYTQPELTQKIKEANDTYANHSWLVKPKIWNDLEYYLESLLPPQYENVIAGLTGSDSIDNAIKFVWKYWQNKGTPRKTILVRKGSFHSGSITGWKMTIDTMRWTKHIPDVNYVDFYDKDFNDVYEKHKEDVAGVIVDTVSWFNGINKIDDETIKLLKRMQYLDHVPVIADEIITGFWRLGAFSHSLEIGLTPNIICFGKFSGGGFADISLCVVDKFIMESVARNNDQGYPDPLPMGNTRSQNTSGAVACVEIIKHCMKHKMGDHIKQNIFPFVVECASVLSECRGFNITFYGSMLICDFGKNDVKDFLMKKGLWQPSNSRMFFFPFYNITNQEKDHILKTFKELVNEIR